MESCSLEEVVASYSSSSTGGDCQQHASAVTKRKRTKRLRAFPSPHADEEGYLSTTTTTEEEEDMANCLILLAQGRSFGSSSPREEKFTSRKFAETVTTAGAKAGFYVYECKTCNKCFPSFQALGGHRASHKKPRLAGNTTDPATATTKDNNSTDHDGLEISMNSFSKSTSNIHVPAGSNNKFRVHECSICGSEFASGQALGGHMRRHRPVGPAVAASGSPEANIIKKEEKEKEKEKEETKASMLSLDLNLPAPSEETVAFAFAEQRPVAFSSTAAALVDCHY